MPEELVADAEKRGTAKKGTALLAEVCRLLREASEEQLAADAGDGGFVVDVLIYNLRRGIPCVKSPVPLWELNAVDATEGTALHFAASKQLPSAALALLACTDFDPSVPKQRERDGSTALHLAAAEGLETVVQTLLDRLDFADVIGALDKDGFSALHGAAFRGHLGCVQLILRSPLVRPDLAATVGEFDVVRPSGHWAREANELYDMNTALHMAAAAGHAKLCSELLLAAPSVANKANRMGATALHMAAKGGHAAACSALLETPGFTAVSARDARGFTALHWGAQQVSGDVCAAIMKREDFTAVECKDLKGRTAANIAEEMGHFEVQHVILKRSL